MTGRATCGLLTLLAIGLGAGSGADGTGKALGASPPRFRVRRHELLGPDGTPVRFRGFNVLWWAPPTAQDARDIKALGANSVRYMFGCEPEGAFDPARVAMVKRQIRLFTEAGLWVIPTVHKFERAREDGAGLEQPWNSRAVQREFLDMWTHLIGELKDEPRVIAWEPANEPHDVGEGELRRWHEEVVAYFRGLDPSRPIVIEGVGYSGPGSMREYLKLDDPNVIYSFHMYRPHEYTHQGDAPVEYPGKWDRADLAEMIAPAREFGDRFDVPVWCGEWGVVTKAPGFEQWLEDVSAVIEGHGFHWSHWAWCVKPEPVNGTFDVNTHKERIYETMKRVFREATAPEPRIMSAPPERVFTGNRYHCRVISNGRPLPRIRVHRLPGWLRFDGRDTISGTPEPGDAGESRPITVIARNAAGTDRLRFTVTVVHAVRGTGTGLRGEYFARKDLTDPKLVRTDPVVDFDWPGSPAPGLEPDAFSVRWTGEVQAQLTETYTFATVSDDGARLWVDGKPLVDAWKDQGATECSGQVSLVAGRKYGITMEYYESGGGAVARLLWSSASTPKQAIPRSQLYPATTE